MTTTTVRLAQRADLPAAAQLAAGLVRLHHSFDAKRFLLLEPLEIGYERFLLGELSDADAVVTVAEHEGKIVGYSYARLEPRDWNALRDACGAVHDIYVDESMRGAGVATALMNDMLARLKAKGAPRVVLMTASGNTGAQQLFAKLGFRPTMVEMTLDFER